MVFGLDARAGALLDALRAIRQQLSSMLYGRQSRYLDLSAENYQ